MEKEKCELCYGTGLMDCAMEYGDDSCPDDCPACGGDNKVMCLDCSGSGEVDEQ